MTQSQLGLWHWAGGAGRGAGPNSSCRVLIVLGLFTRLAALGMVGFVVVQSLTDIFGHGAARGRWFDRASDALILDQRAFWLLLFACADQKGAGPLSADRLPWRLSLLALQLDFRRILGIIAQ